MSEDLIPCTVELERLKFFLRAVSQMNKNYAASGARIAEYYEGQVFPPYTKDELINTPWTGHYG